MKYTIGSALQLIPASPDHKVKLTWRTDEHDYVPLLGWAIVVTWNGDTSEVDSDQGEQETRIEPVALVDGMPCTASNLRHDGISCEVIS